MRLLVAENGNELPLPIKSFLHDQESAFPSPIKQFGFAQLKPLGHAALFSQTDGLVAQSAFVYKETLEKVVHLFTEGVFRDKPYRFYIWGLVHHLNLWIAPRMTAAQKNEEFGFQDYEKFEHSVMQLLERNQLFNIEEDKQSPRVRDSFFNRETGEEEFFNRHRYHALPVLFNARRNSFSTRGTRATIIRKTIPAISQI